MNLNPCVYTTSCGINIFRSSVEVSLEDSLKDTISSLDSSRGGVFTSNYEYPGRYKRWSTGFINPPVELSTVGNSFVLRAHNDRGSILLSHLSEWLNSYSDIEKEDQDKYCITGYIKPTKETFAEEDRSRQPSIFTIIRSVMQAFYSPKDSHLGLYGAFGYDLIFQFESVPKLHKRPADQKDLVLYLPDSIEVVDYYLQRAFRLDYEFETKCESTKGLSRIGETINYNGLDSKPSQSSDHAVGEYAGQVREAIEYFRRGDLFEVVPSQSLYRECREKPSKLFHALQKINPSPYGFILNLGTEYLIGSSPEMFVRVEGRRVETCPISGTVKRGRNALEDAENIRYLLNSTKDKAELTMCSDVDRSDKSRVCEPGSVQLIGRRQIELYSHLIHTVDHIEGFLRPEFDALDAFLTHLWAVTVTGAPKRAAIQFIEQNEHSVRRWYGGAVGWLSFDGNLNTGLTLRTIRLQNSVAEVRVGATLLYDSVPEDEEQETLTKAEALLQTISCAGNFRNKAMLQPIENKQEVNKSVLLVDYEDSFIHTLANYVRQTGATAKTLRHGFCESVLDVENPDLVILSPGPGRPDDFHVAEMVSSCARRSIPVFGICLGFQGIVEAYGGQLGILLHPQHGKLSEASIINPKSHLFKGLSSPFKIGRYHSLFALPDKMPAELEVTAMSDDGVIMAIEHRSLPIAAVQFHPESIMSLAEDAGLKIIANVIRHYAGSSIKNSASLK